MAWNHPLDSGNAVKRKGDRKVSKGAFLLVGISVLLLVAGFAVYHLWPKHLPKPVNEKKNTPSTITEVKPQLSRQTTNLVVAVTNEVHRRLKPDGTIDHRFDVPPGSYRDERGILRRPGGQRILEAEPKHKFHFRDEKPPIFSNPAENMIAAVVGTESGSILIGGVVFDKRFVEHLKESFDQPIVISPEDDDETVSVKQAVIDAKKELKARMEAGEDIVKVMNDSYAELQAIGKYRQELNSEILKYAREHDDCTEQDIVDYVKAANMMLESRGSSKKIAVPQGLINRLKAQGKLKK